MIILVSGGAGYIGSHVCVELLEQGHEVIVVDNLCNSKREALRRVKEITGKEISFYEADVRDIDVLRKLFSQNPIDAVIHLAGLKCLNESIQQPIRYYDNNVCATLKLCEIMQEFGCTNIVFSSSSTVYGNAKIPYVESYQKCMPTTPYGKSKSIVEDILMDLNKANPKWNVMLLRYFNPVGAHESGLIGEDPSGIPNNLMPYIAQVAVGERECLSVYGDDYDTPDGTPIRDYIHVVDLARGHVKALDKIKENCGLEIYNLGRGNGHSVLEMVEAFSRACGHEINYRIVERREGDLAAYYADSSKAKRELGWEAEYDIDKMCADTWNWQSKNLKGYESE